MSKTYEDGWKAGLRIAARWTYYLVEAAKEMGVDTEELTDRALYRKTREHNGEPELKAAKNLADAAKYYEEQYGMYPKPEAMGHEIVHAGDDYIEIHMHQCPHVTEWEALGLSREQMSELCRYLSKADHGCFDTYEHLDVDLPTALAKGDPYCTLKVTERTVSLDQLK